MEGININFTKFHTVELEQMRDQINAQIARRKAQGEHSDPLGIMAIPPKDKHELNLLTVKQIALFEKIADGGDPKELLTWSSGPVRSRIDMLIKVILGNIASLGDRNLANNAAYVLSKYMARLRCGA